jgi:probable phosphoglycerate mutase
VRLYLIRHGQTESNVNHVLDTAHPGAPLNRTGLAQAEALADRLADAAIEAVYASDLTRAIQTATPLATRRGLGVRQLPELREIPAGVEELTTDWTRYVSTLARWVTEPHFKLDDGEDAHSFFARYDAAVARIADSHEVAAAVSHGAAMRVWVPHRAGNVERPSTRVLANTDVILLEGSATSGWTVLSWAEEVFVP